MAFGDLLLHLDSYPEPTREADIDAAIAFAAAIGGKLTALGIRVTIPAESNRIADYLIGLSKIVREQEKQSHIAAREGLEAFTRKATHAGVYSDALLARADLYDVPDLVARVARTRDMCLIPMSGRFTGQHEVAQTAIFDSGRSVLIFKGRKRTFRKGLGKVVIAWDASAFAARAVAEALPFLSHATEVRVLTVIGEKPSAHAGLGVDLVRHLSAYGVAASMDEIDADGRSIGDVFDTYLTAQAADLLVMGAYGRSQLLELILGGATEHMLWANRVPTLLAH